MKVVLGILIAVALGVVSNLVSGIVQPAVNKQKHLIFSLFVVLVVLTIGMAFLPQSEEEQKPPLEKNLQKVSMPSLQQDKFASNFASSVSVLSDAEVTSWYFQSLQSLTERYNIIHPYKDGTFRAQNRITKAEFIVLLSNALTRFIIISRANGSLRCSYPLPPEYPISYPQDVSENDWYYGYYFSLASATGENFSRSNSLFEARTAITRAEMVSGINKFVSAIERLVGLAHPLTRALSEFSRPHSSSDLLNQKNVGVSQVRDVKPQDLYYEDLKRLLDIYKVALVDSNLKFNPDLTVTRGEFAVILNDTLDKASALVEVQAKTHCIRVQ